MKKTTIALYVGGLIVIGLAIFGIYKYMAQGNTIEDPLKSDPLNTTYAISGQNYTLVNGKVEKEIAPGSASKEKISIFGEPVYADLDGDGDQDAVAYLTQDSGGSGTFYYVVVAVNNNGKYAGTNAMFLGDRIAPQNINIQDGRAVANFAERKAGEDFSVAPSVGKSVWVNLDVKTMQIGELVKDFEGEADPSKMSLGMKVWQWTGATYKDGKKLTAKTDKFKLTFKEDGTFGSSTDCNGIGGNYKVSGSKIIFSEMMSTQMYCEGSQESDFNKILTDTVSFAFTSKGELVLSLKNNTGTAVFK